MERKAFRLLSTMIQRRGILDDWVTLDNPYKDTIPMYVVRQISESNSDTLEEGVQAFLESLIVCNNFYPNDKNKDNDTLLHLLCTSDRFLPLVTLLLSREDTNINSMNIYGCTPLDISILYKSTLITELLTNNGAYTGEVLEKINQKRQKENEKHTTLEEYREMKVNNFHLKTSKLRSLLNGDIKDKKWI